MRKALAIAVAVVAAATLFSLGTAYAEEPDRPKDKKDRPEVVAIAIGLLNEADGDKAIVDFRAAKGDERTGGNLRFYSREHGYYNGAVRRLTVEDGIVKAAGGGGLWRPDGTRTRVRFTAEFSVESKLVAIKVQGREGYEYTMEGKLDPGFIRAGAPPEREKEQQRPDRPKAREPRAAR